MIDVDYWNKRLEYNLSKLEKSWVLQKDNRNRYTRFIVMIVDFMFFGLMYWAGYYRVFNWLF